MIGQDSVGGWVFDMLDGSSLWDPKIWRGELNMHVGHPCRSESQPPRPAPVNVLVSGGRRSVGMITAHTTGWSAFPSPFPFSAPTSCGALRTSVRQRGCFGICQQVDQYPNLTNRQRWGRRSAWRAAASTTVGSVRISPDPLIRSRTRSDMSDSRTYASVATANRTKYGHGHGETLSSDIHRE